MEPIFLLGYDVEAGEPDKTQHFAKKAYQVHRNLGAPCTLFVLGRTLEHSHEALKVFCENDIFDIQQHTYSHKLFKSLLINDGKKEQFVKGAGLDEIREEVEKTKRLLKKYLGVECIGITGPMGYYRGLVDRPDVLEVLHNCGIRFTRTWGRNEHDWQPVPFSVQPFWYELQGFPDILEVCMHGWIDCVWRRVHGWDKKEEFINYIKSNIDFIVQEGLVYSCVMHDWSAIAEDEDMSIVQGILEYALNKGVRVLNYRQFYEMKREEKCK